MCHGEVLCNCQGGNDEVVMTKVRVVMMRVRMHDESEDA